MNVEILRDAPTAIRAAAALLLSWLSDKAARSVMVAGGNTPLPLYEAVARDLTPSLSQGLSVFVLDEYVGVPEDDQRTCTNLLRRTVQQAWRIPPDRFFGLSAREDTAFAGVAAHERRIDEGGGLDAIVLGLGANGHLGFNEPGSARDSGARLVELAPVSVEANRAWFGGAHAPSTGATVGMRTILAARHLLLLAFGEKKADAVRAMLRGPVGARCPASWLREHPDVHVFVDEAAICKLRAT